MRSRSWGKSHSGVVRPARAWTLVMIHDETSINDDVKIKWRNCLWKLSDSQPSVQQVLAIALETCIRKRKKRYVKV